MAIDLRKERERYAPTPFFYKATEGKPIDMQLLPHAMLHAAKAASLNGRESQHGVVGAAYCVNSLGDN